VHKTNLVGIDQVTTRATVVLHILLIHSRGNHQCNRKVNSVFRMMSWVLLSSHG